MRKFRYRVLQYGKHIFFECTKHPGITGQSKQRMVTGSSGYPVMELLNGLYSRGHIDFTANYFNKELSPKEWEEVITGEDFIEEFLSIKIRSDLDLITLCGFSNNVIKGVGLRKNQKELAPKYAKPQSKKLVQSSWLYQHGTSV